jgi:hypothetical protein
MKKSLLVILASSLILATVFTLLAVVPSPVGADGTVENQGFESVIGVEWTVSGTGNESRVCNDPVHSGSCAAQITGSGGSLTQTLDITATVKYDCWGWIYATANVTGEIELAFWRIVGGNTTQVSSTTTLSANDTGGSYQQETTIIEAPWDATHLRIRLGEAGAWGDGEEVRFDDIGVGVEGCFIATAAYGTPLAEEIDALRQFRDQYLMTNPAGRLVVSLYYTGSPPLANLISKHEGLRAVIRMALEPITWFCSRITAPPSP